MPLNFGPVPEEDIKEILFGETVLKEKCKQLGDAISKDFEGQKPLIVGVLNGALVFMADLLRNITIPVEVDTLAVSSYGKTASSGELKFRKDVNEDVKGKHVIIVEDIVDTGKTLQAIGDLFKERGAADIAVCTLLDKKAHRAVEGLNMRYVGFDCPDEFIVGYGIDYAEHYRNLPYIGALKPSVYQ
eukprot:TRINITY_DN98785_c0_g1_i1.p1 TRINITY_DN98785_c0_g1~~TRINITY_DN98785_c0_g1_i1.p1  ORF type:complete len:187 (-),score=55.58 TRINITY_DN98785_c0_g1_i1:35-595(-)